MWRNHDAETLTRRHPGGWPGDALATADHDHSQALVEVHGEPFIAHQLRLLRANGITHVVVVLLATWAPMLQEYVVTVRRLVCRSALPSITPASLDGQR